MAAAFVILLGVAAFAGKLPFAVLWLYLIASTIAFSAYAIDKSAAKNDQRRTRERTLHILGLACGWPGALAAQSLLRHKSRKPSFQIWFWATVTLNCSALGWVITSPDAYALRAFLVMA